MAIERGVDDVDMDELDIEDSSKEILIGVEGEDDQFIEEEDVQTLDDGTMVFGEADMLDAPMMGFNDNLAEMMEEGDLGRVFSNCMADIDDDKASRKDWMDQYKEGLNSWG